MTSVKMRADSAALAGLMALPPLAIRVLAGRPVRIDGNTLDPEIQLILRLQRIAGGGLEKPTVDKGRASMRHDAQVAGGTQPIGRTKDLQVEGADGPLDARLYIPRALVDGRGPDPLLVYFHGGGWTFGDLESHDAVCRFFAEEAGVRVLSVAYRLAPEHPYPAGPQDAWAALQWAAAKAADLGADPERLAVGGDSAGGSLAALAAVRAAEQGLPLRLQLLVYPATRLGRSGPSRQLFGEGFILTDVAMSFFDEQYIGDRHDGDPGHSVGLRTTFPDDLAPTVIAIAGFDPLRDEEKDYVALLRKAGLPVTERYYPGLTHGFVNIVGHGGSCRAAAAELAADLRAGLA